MSDVGARGPRGFLVALALSMEKLYLFIYASLCYTRNICFYLLPIVFCRTCVLIVYPVDGRNTQQVRVQRSGVLDKADRLVLCGACFVCASCMICMICMRELNNLYDLYVRFA